MNYNFLFLSITNDRSLNHYELGIIPIFIVQKKSEMKQEKSISESTLWHTIPLLIALLHSRTSVFTPLPTFGRRYRDTPSRIFASLK